MNGRKPAHAWHDRNIGPVMGVVQDTSIWLGRERKDRMLHRRKVVFRDRIKDIADKEIRLVPVGQQALCGHGV